VIFPPYTNWVITPVITLQKVVSDRISNFGNLLFLPATVISHLDTNLILGVQTRASVFGGLFCLQLSIIHSKQSIQTAFKQTTILHKTKG
jgi:hypothetical protein